MDVELPDGTIVSFPDGMSQADIKAVLAKKFPKASPNAQPLDPMGFPVEMPGGSSVNKQAAQELSDNVQGAGEAFAGNLLPGMTFGFAPEIAAGIGSMFEDRPYAEIRDGLRAQQEKQAAEHPIASAAGQMAGGVLPSVGAYNLAEQGLKMAVRAVNTYGMLPRIGLGALTGTVEGAAYGAGNSPGNRVGGAATGAGIGLGLGAAAPLAVGAVGAIKNAVKNPTTGIIDGMFNVGNKRKVDEAIGKAMSGSGRTKAEIEAMILGARQAGQPEFRMMDALGLPGQKMASGMARNGGDAGNEIAAYLAQRQADQGDRVAGFVDDAFGTKGTTAAKTREGLISDRRDAANKAYAAAEAGAGPVDVRDTVAALDDTISKMTNSGIKPPAVVAEYQEIRNKIAGAMPDGSPTTLSDYKSLVSIWKEVRDKVDKSFNSGDGAIGEALKPIRDSLEAQIAAASDGFRGARAGYREASKVIGAVDEGAAMARRGRAADNVPVFQSMNPEMQGTARIGYGDDLLEKLEKITSPTSNRAKPLQSTKRAAEAEAMTIDPKLYSDRLGRESTMWETQNKALGGSRTADNIADQAAMEGLAGGAFDAAKSVGNFQFGDAVSKVARMVAPLAKGQNEATKKLIAKALMSDDPAKVLAPVLRREAADSKKRRTIEALMRQAGVAQAIGSQQ